MTLSDWMSFVACVGILPLGIVSLVHRGRSPMALPIALLCFDLFTWNFATWAHRYSGNPTWLWLDGTVSPFTPPLMLHAVLVFVGRLRALRGLLVAWYVAYALVSGWTVWIMVRASPLAWFTTDSWSLVYLALWLPLLALSVVLLIRHLRRSPSHDEKMRTRWLIAAVVGGGVGGSTEFADQYWAIPTLGHFTALASAAMVAVVVFRWRLLGRELTSRGTLYGVALAGFGVLGYLVVFRTLSANAALLVLATASITLVLGIGVRDMANAAAGQRERVRHLAALGRFSAQMGHDLKNPLSSLKGAVQFLAEERSQGRSVDEHDHFLGLMAEQIERIDGIIDKYRGLSEIEPAPEPVQLHDLIRELLAPHSLRAPAEEPRIEVATELADELPPCRVDRELVLNALDNVIRNAREAMPEGGTLTVRSRADLGASGGASVIITVQDTGGGMDARELERAFDDFHTTKAEGSGLGLAFVRRVVEAHGGEVLLSSVQGEGTTVRLRLPVAGPPS